jgi:hypothetical protein
MAHHHHKRGQNCVHGIWATDDFQGHHHHKRGSNCVHGLWATDSINGHHHHLRGGACVEHRQWATGEEQADNLMLTTLEFSDDPSIVYDLSQSDRRSYAEVEAAMPTECTSG